MRLSRILSYCFDERVFWLLQQNVQKSVAVGSVGCCVVPASAGKISFCARGVDRGAVSVFAPVQG